MPFRPPSRASHPTASGHPRKGERAAESPPDPSLPGDAEPDGLLDPLAPEESLGDLDTEDSLDNLDPESPLHHPGQPIPEAEDGANLQPDLLEDPQRFADSGVEEDMATAAVHPNTQVHGRTPATRLPASQAPAMPAGGWAELTDAEIMLRVAVGDEAGFTLLVEKYRRQMMHFMFRMVHNQAVAEELAQEVFLRVYRARASYRAEAKFSTWLYRIATNLGVNHARDTRHERLAPAVYLDQTDPETGMTPDVADTTPSVEQDMLREARLAAIRKHVMALPERQRTAVLMHKYQDLDYKQIGAVLKLSESATKSLLFRAYQTLRERLQEFI